MKPVDAFYRYPRGYHVPIAHINPEGLAVKSFSTEGLLKAVERLMQRLFRNHANGQPQPIVDRAVYRETKNLLFTALGEGYPVPETAYNVADEGLVTQFMDNLQVFCLAKTYQQTDDLVKDLRALTGALAKDGKVVSFGDFKESAKKIVKDYNGTWLSAEYDTAIGSAQNGRKWLETVENARTMPFLRYKTARDERVRQSHRPLHNIVLPWDDGFWDMYHPQNGWRCRCFTQQLTRSGARGRVTANPLRPDIPPVFRNNPGKTGRVFPENHPYYRVPRDRFARAKGEVGL